MRYLLLSSCKEGVLEGVILRGEALGGREGRRGVRSREEGRGVLSGSLASIIRVKGESLQIEGKSNVTICHPCN